MNTNKKLKAASKTYTIEPQGSLGLLAAGYKGMRAWREARDGALNEKKTSK